MLTGAITTLKKIFKHKDVHTDTIVQWWYGRVTTGIICLFAISLSYKTLFGTTIHCYSADDRNAMPNQILEDICFSYVSI